MVYLLLLISRCPDNCSQYGDFYPDSLEYDLDKKSLSRKALTSKNDVRRVAMTDTEFAMMPAVIYGFGLADRKWSKPSLLEPTEGCD